MTGSKWLRQGISVFFEYDTPKIVHIRSKKIGIFYRLVQSCVISYIIGYVLVYNKGYQEEDEVVSAVSSKVKGVLLTNYTDEELDGVRKEWKSLYNRVWDVTDFAIPPVETNAFFVTTNLVITPNQTRSDCPERNDLASCQSDRDCPRGHHNPLGNGINTGACNSTAGSCQIFAWCPVENNQVPRSGGAILEDAREFTVLIKNQIGFPRFGVGRTNILESQNSSYLSSCLYHAENDPFCPVFKLEDIVSMAGANWSTVAMIGGLISVGISWDCDLDRDPDMRLCQPQYSFRRLDNPEAKIAPGWNFRHADYFNENKRTLTKAYGINFAVNVWGKAGRFNLIPTLLNLGAGLALLSISTLICDFIVLYILKDKKFYKSKKYLEVKASDAFDVYRRLDETAEERSEVGGRREEEARAGDGEVGVKTKGE